MHLLQVIYPSVRKHVHMRSFLTATDFSGCVHRRCCCCTFHGLDPLTCSDVELTSETMNPVLHILVGLLGCGMGTLQVPYLHRRAQHRKTQTFINVSTGIQTQDPRIPAFQAVWSIGPATFIVKQKIVFQSETSVLL